MAVEQTREIEDELIKQHIALPEEEKTWLGVLDLQFKRIGIKVGLIHKYDTDGFSEEEIVLDCGVEPDELLAARSIIRRYQKYFDANLLMRQAPEVDRYLQELPD